MGLYSAGAGEGERTVHFTSGDEAGGESNGSNVEGGGEAVEVANHHFQIGSPESDFVLESEE